MVNSLDAGSYRLKLHQYFIIIIKIFNRNKSWTLRWLFHLRKRYMRIVMSRTIKRNVSLQIKSSIRMRPRDQLCSAEKSSSRTSFSDQMSTRKATKRITFADDYGFALVGDNSFHTLDVTYHRYIDISSSDYRRKDPDQRAL